MEDRNRENLGELFEKFFDAEQAESYLKDFQEAERIFRDNPAPKPNDMLIANIKAEIAMRLPVLARHRTYRRAVAVAAIVIVAGIIATLFDGIDHGPGRLVAASLIPTAVWESDNIASDDEDLAFFATEIEQIENEVRALEADEDTNGSDSTIAELEMELIVISSDFWKE